MNKNLKQVKQEFADRKELDISQDGNKMIIINSEKFINEIKQAQIGVVSTGFLDIRCVDGPVRKEVDGDTAIRFIENILEE